ncbi:MAG TPA: DASS family sodium-coupled anion symporter [Chthoniobacteraceae bacterium]|nr:DASS family sodium-coupled anion symporter [Chthoniobacteraceae bacterium]
MNESTFDLWRARVGTVLAPIVFFALWFAPLPLSYPAHALAAILGLTIVLWVTEAIPMAATALLGPALCVVFGVAKDKEVFASFGHPICMLFIGSFLLAQAMQKHDLDRRLALSLLCVPGVAKTPGRVLAALGGLTAALSMWMSNSAITAVMLPIALGVLHASPRLAETPGAKSGVVLMIAFAASIGGLATPVGTPTNLVALAALKEYLGRQISFFDWMYLAVPLASVLMVGLFFILRPRGSHAFEGADVLTEFRKQRDGLGPLRPGERNAAIAFFTALTLWMYPGLAELFGGEGAYGAAWLKAHFPEETIGLMTGLLLFFLPVSVRERKFTIDWGDAKEIDWGTVLLFGGGLALGKAIFDTGLAKTIGDGVISTLGNPGQGALIAAAIVLSILLSEATSNTASASATGTGFTPAACETAIIIGTITLATCLACSFGFMLPISTPPNALAYATGLVRLPQMVRSGIILDCVGGVTIWLMVMWLSPK